MNENEVAIIGVAGRFPGAVTITAYKTLLEKGTIAHQPVPAQRWNHAAVYGQDRSTPDRTPARLGGFMDDFDSFCPEYFGISPKRARIMDPQQRLMLETVRQALDDAGYRRRLLGDGRTGVYMGVSSSDHRGLVDAGTSLAQLLSGRVGVPPPWSEAERIAMSAAIPSVSGYTIVGQQANMVAAQVSEAFDFRGPSFAVDTACSSALVALHEAMGHLRTGQVDAAVVGGVYVLLDPGMMVCFSRIGALSRTDRCLPFSNQADGFVLGEGVGAVVLKRLADARRDGDPIAAIISGSAVNNDGRGGGPFTPLLRGQREVLDLAWRDAGEDPADVGYVEAHGTATKVGDRIELEAIQAHFHGALADRKVPLGAVKANIGHTVASAGMASLLKAVLSLRNQCVFAQPGNEADRSQVAEAGLLSPTETTGQVDLRLVGVSAFGFGGTNAHVVLKVGTDRSESRLRNDGVVWRFTAPDRAALDQYLISCYAWLRPGDGWTCRGVAAVLDRREQHAVECQLIGKDEAELLSALAEVVGEGEAGESIPDRKGGPWDLLPPLRLSEQRYWIVDDSKRQPVEAVTASHAVEAEDAASQALDESAVWGALTEVTGLERSQITSIQRLRQDLGFDSLMALELEAALRKKSPDAPDLEEVWSAEDLSVGGLIAHLCGGPETVVAVVAPEVIVDPSFAPVPEGWSDWPEVRMAFRRRDALIQATGGEDALPYFQTNEPAGPGCCWIGGRELINFSSYDYLGLARDERVTTAAADAVRRWGASANASRLAAGERPVHAALEQALAAFLGTSGCLTMVGGYGTNVSLIGHLLGPGDLLLHDKLAHESILAGGRLSGARMRAFKHNDPQDLQRELEIWRPLARRILIAVEGVYSMDGDIVPLPEIVALKQHYDALLMVDEAHSLGVVGATGRGVGELFNVARADVDLWMGTLSKALASCGGYVAGDSRLIEYLRYTMPGFVYSVGLPPGQAAAALAALNVLIDEPERVTALRMRSDALRAKFRSIGVDVGRSSGAAVVPWMLGASDRALRCAGGMNVQGVFVHSAIAPAVEEGSARLRFFVTAAHLEAQLDAVGVAAEALLRAQGQSGDHAAGAVTSPMMQAGSADRLG